MFVKNVKLLITDLNQLNKPFIPPNLTNLFLLNDHDMIIIIIIKYRLWIYQCHHLIVLIPYLH